MSQFSELETTAKFGYFDFTSSADNYSHIQRIVRHTQTLSGQPNPDQDLLQALLASCVALCQEGERQINNLQQSIDQAVDKTNASVPLANSLTRF